jgi:hypothetical protein
MFIDGGDRSFAAGRRRRITRIVANVASGRTGCTSIGVG